LPVLLVLRDVEVACDADFHWIVGAANGLRLRPEEFDPLLDQIRAGKLVEQEVETARRDHVDRWLTARTHPDRWPRPLRGGLDDDILEIPELAMMGEAPFHALRARRENTEKAPTTLKLARQWALGLTHGRGTTAGNIERKSNRSREERSSQGWLAVGAVAVEPFSTGQFLANREKIQGKFAKWTM